MKVLITGAYGFTGLHFSGYLEAQGHEVVPLIADLTDRESLNKEVDLISPDWVVHLAAISFVGHHDISQFYSVNVIGTLNLLDSLANLQRKPSSVLIASSANIYGNCQHSPINESQSPAPVNHYAASKLAMEHLAQTYIDRLPLFFVRPFNYTGPGQAKSFLIPKLVDHFVRKEKSIELGNLKVEREFNDVRMVCAAYYALLESAVTGQVYNVCSGHSFSIQDVISILEEITSHKMLVHVNSSLVRSSEVHRLCGNPNKLLACTGPLTIPTLQQTLSSMLSKY